MFKCNYCEESVRQKENRVLTHRRPVVYQKYGMRYNNPKRQYFTQLQSESEGWEIAKDVRVCNDCLNKGGHSTDDVDTKFVKLLVIPRNKKMNQKAVDEAVEYFNENIRYAAC